MTLEYRDFFPGWEGLWNAFYDGAFELGRKDRLWVSRDGKEDIQKTGMQKAQVSQVRSPAGLTCPSKCTILTSLVQAISPLSCHTCYKFCAFFHPPGQVALLLDLGDTAFHNPPHPGVNYRSKWDTKQATARWVRIRVFDKQFHSLRPSVKTGEWKWIAVRLRGKRCSFESRKTQWKNLKNSSLFVVPLDLQPRRWGQWMITLFANFPAARLALWHKWSLSLLQVMLYTYKHTVSSLLGARHCSKHSLIHQTLSTTQSERDYYHFHHCRGKKWGQHRKDNKSQTQLEMEKTWFAAWFHARCSSSLCPWPCYTVFTLYQRTAYRVPHSS